MAIFSGSSGTRKSPLSIAIACRAIQHGDEARFVGGDALIGELSAAATKGRLTARHGTISDIDGFNKLRRKVVTRRNAKVGSVAVHPLSSLCSRAIASVA